jgi:putative PIN family toxin of toxin-antitoxin system
VITAVLDTNVIVSAVLIRGGVEDRVLRAWFADQYRLVLSAPILEEVQRVLQYPRIRAHRWMSDEETGHLLEQLAESSLLVEGKQRLRVCRDPADDKFVVAAMEGQANYIVTGDADLLDLGKYRDSEIVTPRQFLQVLHQEPSG